MKTKGLKITAILFISMALNLTLFAQEENENGNGKGKATGPKYGNDSALCVTNLSLYGEFYKQKNYADAYLPWQYVFNNCPLASKNTFIRGITIVKFRYNKEKNKDIKLKLLDTLMMVYDKRIEFFGDEGFVLGRKGLDLYAIKKTAAAFEVYEILKKSVELEGNKSKPDVLLTLMQVAVEANKATKLDKAIVLDVYDNLSTIIDWNIRNNAKDTNYNPARIGVDLTAEPYLSCPDLISIYTPKFEQNKEDLILLKKITKILDKKNCTESDLFYKATENLHKLEPTAQSAYLMGKLAASRKDWSKCADYYKQASELYTDSIDKYNAYYGLADAYKNMNQYGNARAAAYKAIENNPKDGKSYILIGDMYAASAASCGDNEVTNKAAYWAAVDKYYKARTVETNQSIIDIATARINAYSGYFPKSEDIFFHGFQVGASYTVGCWINETTTIRGRN